jgi:hypothetical protein
VRDLGRDDVHFHLAGDGPELDRLRQQSAALGIADHVTFGGWIADHQLLEMLSTADVCVCPDDVNEMNDKSTMNKIMEYMAVGKPIVQFEMTEGRYSAQGASLYARPNDVRDFALKLVELLDDPERRQVMGEIGRARIDSELAWSHQIPKLLAAYDAAFAARSARRGQASGERELGRRPSETIEISVKGKAVVVPAVRVHGRAVVVSGRWLRIARIHDEEWIPTPLPEDPGAFVRVLRNAAPTPDLFTFEQALSRPPVEHPYPFELEDVAAIEITTHSDWWNALPRIGRKNVRRAERRGVVVERARFDDALVRGIKEIYDETPVRQGRRFWHFGKDLETVRRINANYLDRSDFLAAYHGGRLIGFMKIVYTDRVARIMQILSSKEHSDKRPSNALLAKAVEVCCQRGMTHLVYGRYFHGGREDTPLSDFKRRNGFKRIELRRYFVPLTLKGEAALTLRLHLGVAHLLPRAAARFALKARTKLYTRWPTLGGVRSGRHDVPSSAAGIARDRTADT